MCGSELNRASRNRAANPGPAAHAFLFGLLVVALAATHLPALVDGKSASLAALCLAMATACAGLARRLPLQAVVLAAVVLAVIEGLAQVLRFPFQSGFSWQIGGSWRPHFSGTQLLLWVLVVLNARAIAKSLLLWSARIPCVGLWILALATILVVIDLHLWGKIFLVSKGASQMRFPLNFGAEAALALVSNVAILPALLDKRSLSPSVDFQPLLLWTLLTLAAIGA